MKVWPGTTTYNKKELKGKRICSINSVLEKFAQKFGRGRGRAGLSYGFLTQMRSYPPIDGKGHRILAGKLR